MPGLRGGLSTSISVDRLRLLEGFLEGGESGGESVKCVWPGIGIVKPFVGDEGLD